MSDLITKPEQSLIRQSSKAREHPEPLTLERDGWTLVPSRHKVVVTPGLELRVLPVH